MLNNIINWLNRNEYMLHWYSIFFNRFYIIRRGLYKGIAALSEYIKGNVLDFGCGYKPYKNVFTEVKNYYGVDFEGTKHLYNSADAYYDGSKLKFEDNFFDGLICTEVLEHVFNIDEVLSELYRVLKVGGYGILTLPFAWDEHEQPFDFGRYTIFGIKHILEKNKFKIMRSHKSGGYLDALGQLFVMYYIKVTFSRYALINIINRITIIPILNMFFFILSAIMPKNYDLYLNHIILIQK